MGVKSVAGVQKKLASVDHIYAPPLKFLDALDAAIRASRKLARAVTPEAGVTLSGCSRSKSHSKKSG